VSSFRVFFSPLLMFLPLIILK